MTTDAPPREFRPYPHTERSVFHKREFFIWFKLDWDDAWPDATGDLPVCLYARLPSSLEQQTAMPAPAPSSYRTYESEADATAALRAAWRALPGGDRAAIRIRLAAARLESAL